MRDINLLPEETKVNNKDVKDTIKGNTETAVDAAKEKGEKKSSGKAKAVLLAIAAVLVVGCSLAIPKIYLKQLDNLSINLSNSINDPKYKEVNQVNSQLAELDQRLEVKKAVIHDIDAKSYPVTEILLAVRNACPEGCRITELGFNENQVRISGVAASTLLAAEYMSNLDSLEHFKKTGTSESLAIGKANASTQFNFAYDIGEGGK